MSETTRTTDAAISRQRASDPPPIGRFLLLFAGMLALALGLSAV